MYYCHAGIGDCTSLQELMHGFSSGTISILDYQEDLQIGAASCVLECQLCDAETVYRIVIQRTMKTMSMKTAVMQLVVKIVKLTTTNRETMELE